MPWNPQPLAPPAPADVGATEPTVPPVTSGSWNPKPVSDDAGQPIATSSGSSVTPPKLSVLDQANADTMNHKGGIFSFFDDSGAAIKQGWEELKASMTQPDAMNLSTGKQDALGNVSDLYTRGLSAASAVGKTIEGIAGAVSNALGITPAIQGEFQNMVDALAIINPSMVEDAATLTKMTGDEYNAWAQKNPDAADQISKWKHTITGAMIAKAAIETIPKIPGAVGKAFDVANSAIDKVSGAMEPVTDRLGGAYNASAKALGGLKDKVLGGPPAKLPGYAPGTNPIDPGVGADAAQQAMGNMGQALPPNPAGATLSPQAILKAKKLGIPDQHLAIVRGATPDDIEAMQAMQGRADASLTSMPGSVRPEDVIGEKAMDQVKYLSEQRTIVGKALGESVKAMDPTPLDISDAKGYFEQRLADDGVRFTQPIESGNPDMQKLLGKSPQLTPEGLPVDPGATGLDFSNSPYKNDMGAQKLLNGINDELQASGGKLSPTEIRTLRQTIFRDTNGAVVQSYIKANDPITTMIEHTRSLLNQPLKDASTLYAELNDKYRLIKATLRDTYDIAGKAFSEDPAAPMDLRLGEISQRLGSNASAATQRVFDQLNQTAKDLGFKGNVDYKRLDAWARALDTSYPETQGTSLGGRVETAIGNTKAALQAGSELVTGHPFKAAEKVYNWIGSVSVEEYRKGLDELLSSAKALLR